MNAKQCLQFTLAKGQSITLYYRMGGTIIQSVVLAYKGLADANPTTITSHAGLVGTVPSAEIGSKMLLNNSGKQLTIYVAAWYVIPNALGPTTQASLFGQKPSGGFYADLNYWVGAPPPHPTTDLIGLAYFGES